nr:hypothetical protein [Aquimarina algiphila]
MEVLKDAGLGSEKIINPLISETKEILKVVSKARKNKTFD